MPPIRVLVFEAIPKTANKVGQGEMERIISALEKAGRTNEFEFRFCADGTLEALSDALTDFSPHIIHFIGHGNEAEIILTTEDGEPFILVPAHLTRLVRKFPSVLGIFANVCWGAASLAPLVEGNDGLMFLLGNEVAEYDDVAARASRGFYISIAKGRNLKDSADLAATHADAHRININTEATDGGFKLLTRGGVRADKINLAKEATRVDAEIAASKIPLVLFHHAMDDLTMIERMLSHFSGRPLRYERVTEHTPATKIASLWERAALIVRCMSTDYIAMDNTPTETGAEELVLMLRAVDFGSDQRFEGISVWPEDHTPAASAYVESETDHGPYGEEGLDDRRQNATEEALLKAAIEIMRRVGAL